MGKEGRCKLTNEFCPSLDEHHVIPREYGGEDGPTILLRPDIHQLLHRSVSDLNTREHFLNSLPRQTRIYGKLLVETIIKAKIDFERKNPEQKIVKVGIEMPYALKKKLETHAKDKGMSVNTFILRLLESLK